MPTIQNVVKIRSGVKKDNKAMNQSLSKLSEKLRHNSSNGSMHASGSKLKLKFKPKNETISLKINRDEVDGKREAPERRDRHTRATGLKSSILSGVAQGMGATQQKKVPGQSPKYGDDQIKKSSNVNRESVVSNSSVKAKVGVKSRQPILAQNPRGSKQ